MVKFLNTTTISGTVEEVDLVIGQGKESGRTYLRGKLVIQTSDNNFVPVNVLQMFDKKDKKNPGKFIPDPRFADLLRLFDAEKETAKPEAIGTPISIAGAFQNNVFVTNDGEMVEAINIGAGFYNYSRLGSPRAEFKTTVVLRSIIAEVDKQTEEETGSYILRGETFDFKGTKVPVRFFVEGGAGANYFLNQEGSFPLLTDVWGRVENAQTAPKVVESAFGEPQVVESTATRVKYLVTGAAVVPHEMNDELALKIKQGATDYEIVKANAQEYHDNKDNSAPSVPTPPGGADKPKSGGFNF